ncbi:MAG: M24 family metallopeptidase [Anaerolineae bacterium]|nr:M24 family metallopeptidase [Anaerolineae bacterium]
MKSDLDRLMAVRNLEALVVVSDHDFCPPRDYLTNGAKVTGGLLLKKRGAAPLMIVNSMEIEEAKASELEVLTFYDLGYAELIEALQGDRSRAMLHLWQRALEHEAVPPGRVGIYGTGAANEHIELARELNEMMPAYEFVGESGTTLFDEAAITKDADEIERIKAVADGTNAAIRAVWDYIASHHAQGDTVVDQEGKPLTIGDVKRFIRRALLDHDLEDTGMIFAQGRDAGFPHSRGQDNAPLKTGQAIVFDLFPRQLGGGYHHDMTRTWCIDYAPPAVQQAYDEVMEAFDISLEAYAEPGQPAHTLQDAVLDYLESKGHPTQRSQPGTMNGYVHSLGHGVGLNIHEAPAMSHLRQEDILQVGNVITIEPGVYYPDQGFGVRIEDMLYIDASGQFVTLTDFPKDLILPLKG